MEKSRVEVIKCVDSQNELSIVKRELNQGRSNSIKTIAAILGLALFLLYIFGDDIIKSLGTNRWILYAGSVLLILIIFFIQKINYRISLSYDLKRLSSQYLILGFIPVSTRNVSIKDITHVSIVRYNILSTLLDGPTIRSLFSIHNKYVIYAMLGKIGYERIIRFDNYLEAKNVSLIISDKFKCRILDNTETEYLDEDQYISSYVRYNELISNVKSEMVEEKDV